MEPKIWKIYDLSENRMLMDKNNPRDPQIIIPAQRFLVATKRGEMTECEIQVEEEIVDMGRKNGWLSDGPCLLDRPCGADKACIRTLGIRKNVKYYAESMAKYVNKMMMEQVKDRYVLLSRITIRRISKINSREELILKFRYYYI